MRSKNVKRYIPQSINKFLLSKNHYHYHWVLDIIPISYLYELEYEGLVITVDTILRIAGTRDVKNNNFCEIQSDSFMKILHKDYSKYLDYLIDNEIIISDNKYIKGEKAIGYKINEDLLDDLVAIDINDKNYNKRTLRSILNNTTKDKLQLPLEYKMRFYKDLKIDETNALSYMINCFINNIPDKKGRILDKYTKTLVNHKILQISNNDIWINRSNTNGRINSSLTALNSDYKQFIYDYNYNLDIISSQPTCINILVDLLKSLRGKTRINGAGDFIDYIYKIMINSKCYNNSNDFIKDMNNITLPSDAEMVKYKKLCEEGLLYEYFMKQAKILKNKHLNRQEAKQIMITILYSNNYIQNEYKELFNQLFPSLNNFIKQMKRVAKIKRSHRTLSIMLQAVESYIWIEQIVPALIKMKVDFHTIHDSVIIKNYSDIDKVRTKILEIFYKYKINVAVSVEDLKTIKKI